MNVLFICTGNTCRSFFAERILKDILSKNGKTNIKVESAGLNAWEGEPASPNAIEVLKEKGIDSLGHRARKVSKEIVDRVDIILCMTRLQKMNMFSSFPSARDRIFMINEYSCENESDWQSDAKDVSDPYGMPIETYRKCLEELEIVLEKIYQKIIKNY